MGEKVAVMTGAVQHGQENQVALPDDEVICPACAHHFRAISQADQDRLRTLLSSSRGEQGWRTMDSAPTDGTPIIGNTQFGAREIWCPGFVAVELTEYPDGRTCAGYLPGFAPDSRAMYAALLKASHGGTKDAG